MERTQERRVNRIGKRSIEIFTDTSHPASFSHPEKVLRSLREEGHGYEHATLHQVKKALATLPSYSRHRLIQKRSHTMTTRSDDVDERWQLDLANVTSLNSDQNDGYKYLLLILDVFSRKLAIVPLYDKKSEEVSEGTELIFMTTGRVPKSITSDNGQEFQGKAFKSLCRKYGIKQFYTVSDKTHASLVERVIRTLRMKIGKMMTYRRSQRYIHLLGDVVDSYNESRHSTLGMSPNEASSSIANRQLALFHLRGRLNQPNRPRKDGDLPFSEGDKLRIPEPFRRFRKSHEPTFSEKVYPVTASFFNDKSRAVTRLAEGGKPAHYTFELSEAR